MYFDNNFFTRIARDEFGMSLSAWLFSTNRILPMVFAIGVAPNFERCVHITDKAKLSREDIANFDNNHLRANENPRDVVSVQEQ